MRRSSKRILGMIEDILNDQEDILELTNILPETRLVHSLIDQTKATIEANNNMVHITCTRCNKHSAMKIGGKMSEKCLKCGGLNVLPINSIVSKL